MKLHVKKGAAAALLGTLAFLALGAQSCDTNNELQQREQQQAAKKATGGKPTLELTNLKKKKDLEENPSQLRYVYVMSYAQIIGYYVAKGKVSSSGSQLTPEQDLIYTGSVSGHVPVDGPKDDGSYGAGDPGIFFFTPEGVMVETSLDYIISTEPINVDVPRLDKKA